MRVITGFMPPTSGTVTVAGLDVVKEPVEAKRRLGYLPENVVHCDTAIELKARILYQYFLAAVSPLSV